jgi:ParB-like chromosome segregation protein Spo0J
MKMTIEIWPTSRPVPYARNARRIPDLAIQKVAASILSFGWQQPIVVDGAGVVIVGHCRLLAAKSLGLTELPVRVASNLTPPQVRAYRLMDNRSHEESSWNREKLVRELRSLESADIDLGLTGFATPELDHYLATTAATATTDLRNLLNPIGERETNQSKLATRQYLSWGEQRVAITPDEIELLNASLATYSEDADDSENPDASGWIQHLLGTGD